ncbi:uncharacterized protein J3D65DRAFT_132780 [Phyllosticta citribraziliensis]|uniref:Uncharacterized protein n=1 Tax=Phyllosticta citribraziliensis TaxID=989973 RepID=A0ABR1L8E2_9PEZI
MGAPAPPPTTTNRTPPALGRCGSLSCLLPHRRQAQVRYNTISAHHDLAAATPITNQPFAPHLSPATTKIKSLAIVVRSRRPQLRPRTRPVRGYPVVGARRCQDRRAGRLQQRRQDGSSSSSGLRVASSELCTAYPSRPVACGRNAASARSWPASSPASQPLEYATPHHTITAGGIYGRGRCPRGRRRTARLCRLGRITAWVDREGVFAERKCLRGEEGDGKGTGRGKFGEGDGGRGRTGWVGLRGT